MSHRRARVASELRTQIGEIIALRVRDPRLRSLTVVEVRPSPDFSFARVFYRTLEDPAEVAQSLERAKPFIRHCLAQVCRLRRVPELDLRLDTSLERAARVERLLGEVGAPTPGDAADEEEAPADRDGSAGHEGLEGEIR